MTEFMNDPDPQETDNNLGEFLDIILSGPPREPCSIGLQLHESIATTIPPMEQAVYIFEILTELLFGMIARLYGTNDEGMIVLSDLSLKDFQRLREYFWGFEYDIVLTIDPDSSEPFDPTDYRTLHSIKLLTTPPNKQ